MSSSSYPPLPLAAQCVIVVLSQVCQVPEPWSERRRAYTSSLISYYIYEQKLLLSTRKCHLKSFTEFITSTTRLFLLLPHVLQQIQLTSLLFFSCLWSAKNNIWYNNLVSLHFTLHHHRGALFKGPLSQCAAHPGRCRHALHAPPLTPNTGKAADSRNTAAACTAAQPPTWRSSYAQRAPRLVCVCCKGRNTVAWRGRRRVGLANTGRWVKVVARDSTEAADVSV